MRECRRAGAKIVRALLQDDVIKQKSLPPTQVVEADITPRAADGGPTCDSAETDRGGPIADVSQPPPLPTVIEVSSAINGPSHRDRVWTLLLKSNQKTLRKLCQDFSVVQRGRKDEVANKVFMSLCEGCVDDTTNAEDMHRVFSEWNENQFGHTI